MPDQATPINNITDHTVAWDWENKHVSDAVIDNNKAAGAEFAPSKIVEAGTVLLCAGPANISKAAKQGKIRLVPIGLVENASISISKQLNRIYEIGSKLNYIVSGRVMGGLNLARVFFNGPNLLKALYKGEVASDYTSEDDITKKKVDFISDNVGEQEVATIGSGDIAMNLDSVFYDNPFGLCFIFRDVSDNSVSEIYFEECNISNYGMGISARANVLSESTSIQFTKIRPINTVAKNVVGGDKTDLADVPIIGELTSVGNPNQLGA